MQTVELVASVAGRCKCLAVVGRLNAAATEVRALRRCTRLKPTGQDSDAAAHD